MRKNVVKRPLKRECVCYTTLSEILNSNYQCSFIYANGCKRQYHAFKWVVLALTTVCADKEIILFIRMIILNLTWGSPSEA